LVKFIIVLFLVQIYFSVSNFNFILVLKPAIVGCICDLLQLNIDLIVISGEKEPANLISTLIQTHARQFYILALTRFFLILESSTTNVWNAKNACLSPPSRVIWILDHMKVMHSSSADQSNLGVDVSIHVQLYAISGRNPPQAFLK